MDSWVIPLTLLPGIGMMIMSTSNVAMQHPASAQIVLCHPMLNPPLRILTALFAFPVVWSCGHAGVIVF